MNKKSKLIKSLIVILGVITLAFGIVILSTPNLNSHTVAILLGLAIILEGTSFTLLSSYPKNKGFYALAELILGCVLVVFGAIIMINTNITLYFVGIFVIVVAFVSLFHQGLITFERKKIGLKYASTVVFGLVHGIFGGLLIYLIPCNDALIISIIGSYLLVLGVITITTMANPRDASELT